MSVIADIDQKASEYIKSGLECPDFVHLSPDVYSLLMHEMNNSRLSSHSTGLRTLSVYTSAGQLNVVVARNLNPGSIIVGDNAIVVMMLKLGDIF